MDAIQASCWELSSTTLLWLNWKIGTLDGIQFVSLAEGYAQKNICITKDNIACQECVNIWSHLKEVKIATIQAEVPLLIVANVPKAMEPLQVQCPT